MASIQDFLSAIGIGSQPNQLGLADILSALGQAAGPTLAARGGRIGMPLGFGLSTVGALGQTLSDRQAKVQQNQQNYEALRGMLPLIKKQVPEAENMLQGVRQGGLSADEYLKYIEDRMKPTSAVKTIPTEVSPGKWINEPEIPGPLKGVPLGAVSVQARVAEQKAAQQEREQFAKDMEKARQGDREALVRLAAALRPGPAPTIATGPDGNLYKVDPRGLPELPRGTKATKFGAGKGAGKPTLHKAKEQDKSGTYWMVTRRTDLPGSPVTNVEPVPETTGTIRRAFGAYPSPPPASEFGSKSATGLGAVGPAGEEDY